MTADNYGIRKDGKPRANAAKCGTPSGARAHRRKGERACGDCLAAESKATRSRPSHELSTKARRRALRDLARLHPEEYQALRRGHLADLKERA